MKSFTHLAAGIAWYCETRGKGPHVVLIPSGEGDCGSFARVAEALADEFSVLTFDMPGFSRSTAPPNFGKVTMGELAGQVAALVRSLDINRATFYGCSSGGQVGLTLVAEHPDLVQSAMVHEVPLGASPMLESLNAMDDAAIAGACKEWFRTQMNEDPTAWDDLGADYHRRLEANYVTWVRHYVHSAAFRPFGAAELKRRPITWTLGGLSPTFVFFDNHQLAHSAGIEIGLLMCRHFPQVSIPAALAEHIRMNTRKYLKN